MRALRMVLFMIGGLAYVGAGMMFPDFIWYLRLATAAYIALLLYLFRNVPWTTPAPSLNLTEQQYERDSGTTG